MTQLFLLSGTMKRDPAVDAWLRDQPGELGALARTWFGVMRRCGRDVREVLHDGHPTACVAGAAFAYVNVFRTHVNVGFFRGVELRDPAGLLEGTGKLMRHVKLRPGHECDETALKALIETAYADVRERVRAADPVLATADGKSGARRR
jgi:hypothetical protein